MTSQDILNYNRERRALREQTQEERNLYCVSRINELLNLSGTFSDETNLDGILIFDNNIKAEFEVTESSPCDESNVEQFSPTLENGMGVCGNMLEWSEQLITKALNTKEKKNYSCADKINLIIYLNPPVGLPDENGLSWAIPVFDLDDFDIPRLKKLASNSRFGSIIVLSCSTYIFIKNEKLVYI
jgi:hypothetical protein